MENIENFPPEASHFLQGSGEILVEDRFHRDTRCTAGRLHFLDRDNKFQHPNQSFYQMSLEADVFVDLADNRGILLLPSLPKL